MSQSECQLGYQIKWNKYNIYGVSRPISISLIIHRAENLIIFSYSPHYTNRFPWNKIFVSGFMVEEKWFLCANNGNWCQAFRYGKMDQCTICLYLNRKGLSAQTFHDKLVQVLWFDVIAYSTVISSLGASRWRAQNEEQHSDPLPILSTTQFFKPLIKSRSCQCKNSQSPCIFHVQRFGDIWRVPCDFLSSTYIGIAVRVTDGQSQIRIDWSRELPRLLESAQANDWQSFMTLDEF
jgi:hypothetical protein